MPRKSNNYVGDCSMRGVAKKFKQLGYMTNINHTISIGNKFIDKSIAKYGARAVATYQET